MNAKCVTVVMLAGVFLLVFAANDSPAGLISLDFNMSAVHSVGPPTSPLKSGPETGGFGHPAGVDWNSLNLGPTLGSSLSGASSGTMVTADGSATSNPVMFTFTSGTYAAYLSPASADLRRDVAFLQPGYSGDSVTWKIDGLIPGNTYNVKMIGQYDATGGPPKNPSAHTINGVGPIQTADVATFSGLTATGTGELNGQWDRISAASSISGLQIQGDFGEFVAPEPVISIDFDENGRTGTTAWGTFGPTSGQLVTYAGQTGTWNSLALGDGANQALGHGTLSAGVAAPTVSGPLADGWGDTTPVSFTFNTTSQGYQVYTQDIPQGNSDNLGRDVPFLASGNSGNVIAWQFDDLMPNTEYALRLFGQSDSAGPSNFATFAVTGGTPASASASAGLNYVDFLVTSDGSGQIVGTFSGSGVSSWSGLQIQGTFTQQSEDIPEPMTILAVALGLASVGRYARKRRRT